MRTYIIKISGSNGFLHFSIREAESFKDAFHQATDLLNILQRETNTEVLRIVMIDEE